MKLGSCPTTPFGLSLSKPPRALSLPKGLSLSKPRWRAAITAPSTRGL